MGTDRIHRADLNKCTSWAMETRDREWEPGLWRGSEAMMER